MDWFIFLNLIFPSFFQLRGKKKIMEWLAEDYITPKSVLVGRSSSHEGSLQRHNNKGRVELQVCSNWTSSLFTRWNGSLQTQCSLQAELKLKCSVQNMDVGFPNPERQSWLISIYFRCVQMSPADPLAWANTAPGESSHFTLLGAWV